MDTFNILDGIGKNLRKQVELGCKTDISGLLSYLHILNIKVSSLGWKTLAKGMGSSQCNLKTLRVNLVDFDREQLSTLLEGMKDNESITHLDLSYNDLKDSYGDIFGRLILDQT